MRLEDRNGIRTWLDDDGNNEIDFNIPIRVRLSGTMRISSYKEWYERRGEKSIMRQPITVDIRYDKETEERLQQAVVKAIVRAIDSEVQISDEPVNLEVTSDDFYCSGSTAIMPNGYYLNENELCPPECPEGCPNRSECDEASRKAELDELGTVPPCG